MQKWSRLHGWHRLIRMQVIVVGAGAGGLSTAAALRRRGVPAIVLERGQAVGTAWRGRYDSLHLHTIRPLSGLPGARIPRAEGRWEVESCGGGGCRSGRA